MININFSQMVDSQEFINICKNYPGCKGCPMLGGKQYQTQNGFIICETGYRKKENSDE